MELIPLYKPYMSPHLPQLTEILYSGQLAYGKWGKAFEKSIAEFLDVPNLVLATNSFSSAILVLFSTLDITSEDEIIISPQSCLASTLPLASYGVKVVWADIDPSRGTLDPESVKEKITSKTKLIFHNHHCGYPGYIDEINAIGKEYGIYIVDDCIEAFGAKYKGKYVGNTGADFSLLSFQTVRLPNTIDGGGIIFKDRTLYERAFMSRDFGIDRRFFKDEKGEINKKNDVQVKGYGAKPNEVGCYIGYQQMLDLDNLLQKQRRNGTIWTQELIHELGIRMINEKDTEPSYWVYGMLADDKEKLMREFRKAGYESSGVHIPNNVYSIFPKSNPLPGVNDFHEKFLAVPSGWWVEK